MVVQEVGVWIPMQPLEEVQVRQGADLQDVVVEDVVVEEHLPAATLKCGEIS